MTVDKILARWCIFLGGGEEEKKWLRSFADFFSKKKVDGPERVSDSFLFRKKKSCGNRLLYRLRPFLLPSSGAQKFFVTGEEEEEEEEDDDGIRREGVSHPLPLFDFSHGFERKFKKKKKNSRKIRLHFPRFFFLAFWTSIFLRSSPTCFLPYAIVWPPSTRVHLLSRHESHIKISPFFLRPCLPQGVASKKEECSKVEQKLGSNSNLEWEISLFLTPPVCGEQCCLFRQEAAHKRSDWKCP